MATPSYRGSHAQMLLAAATIAQSGINHQDTLSAKRPSWKPPFFDNLKAEVLSITEQRLGIISIAGLIEASNALRNMQAKAITALGELKVQLDVDLADNPSRHTEILTTLGYKEYYKAARRTDQQALTTLLYAFKKHLPSLRPEIESHGISPALLDEITALAQEFNTANQSQETQKGTGKEITAEAQQAFNAIYKKVIGVCKIAARFLKENPAVRSQFIYKNVLEALTHTSGSPTTPPPPPANT